MRDLLRDLSRLRCRPCLCIDRGALRQAKNRKNRRKQTAQVEFRLHDINWGVCCGAWYEPDAIRELGPFFNWWWKKARPVQHVWQSAQELLQSYYGAYCGLCVLSSHLPGHNICPSKQSIRVQLVHGQSCDYVQAADCDIVLQVQASLLLLRQG